MDVVLDDEELSFDTSSIIDCTVLNQIETTRLP